MIRVPLFRRNGEISAFAFVDDEDAELVYWHRWFFDGMYAATKVGRNNVRLHRMLMKPDGPHEIDHINRDKLDNRRSNLRVVTHAENCRNVPGQWGSSRFRGVTWEKRRGIWRAQAKYEGRMYCIGRFEFEEDAAAAVATFWAERATVPVNEDVA